MALFDRNKKVQISFTPETVFKSALIITGFVVLLRFVTLITWPLKLIAISVFLALALNPAVAWIAKQLKSKSRVRATAAAYMIVLVILSGFLFIAIPPLIEQGTQVASSIPTTVEDLQNQDTPIVRAVNRYNLQEEYTDFLTTVRDGVQSLSRRAISTATAIGSALVAVAAVLIMTFMMLVEGPGWIKRFWEIMPEEDVHRRKRVTANMYRMVTGYVNGQLLVATLAALFAFVALYIASTVFDAEVNVPALAIIVGLMGLIPMIGNTIAAVIVTLVCLFVSLPLAITMAIFFVVYQQVENATLQPYIQAKYNELTPLTVFIAALIGVSVAGFLGALIAIPIAGCIRIYFLEYHADKLLPEDTKGKS